MCDQQLTGRDIITRYRPKFQQFVKDKFGIYKILNDRISYLCNISDVDFVGTIEAIKKMGIEIVINSYVKENAIDITKINQEDFATFKSYLEFFIDIFG
jgi:hypothetical protein